MSPNQPSTPSLSPSSSPQTRPNVPITNANLTSSRNDNPQPQQQQQRLSFLARALRRRKIRAMLDEVARVVSTPRVDHDDALALFSATDCAVLTHDGEIIVRKAGSTRPFETVAPKIRLLRSSTFSMTQYMTCSNIDVIHLRGHAGMVHAYTLGHDQKQQHTLVAITEVSPGARNLDAVVDRVDRCLTSESIISQLSDMLREF